MREYTWFLVVEKYRRERINESICWQLCENIPHKCKSLWFHQIYAIVFLPRTLTRAVYHYTFKWFERNSETINSSTRVCQKFSFLVFPRMQFTFESRVSFFLFILVQICPGISYIAGRWRRIIPNLDHNTRVDFKEYPLSKRYLKQHFHSRSNWNSRWNTFPQTASYQIIINEQLRSDDEKPEERWSPRGTENKFCANSKSKAIEFMQRESCRWTCCLCEGPENRKSSVQIARHARRCTNYENSPMLPRGGGEKKKKLKSELLATVLSILKNFRTVWNFRKIDFSFVLF